MSESRQEILKRIWLKIQAEIQEIEIARSHDITKSDFGFK